MLVEWLRSVILFCTVFGEGILESFELTVGRGPLKINILKAGFQHPSSFKVLTGPTGVGSVGRLINKKQKENSSGLGLKY